MNTLTYLAFGQGPHTDELIYSVLSARHAAGQQADSFRILVHTDSPAIFQGLPVEIAPVSAATLAEWAGPCGFGHRRKIFAIRETLRRFGGVVVYCDSDTYFLKPPARLFARVSPGHTIMHAREGSPEQMRLREVGAFLAENALHTRSGETWALSPATTIVNAGVIGLHEADAGLLDEVVHLTDQIYPRLRYFGSEQLAFSACFAQRTVLRHADDVVHHYWHPAIRTRFRERIAPVLHDAALGSYAERFQRVLPDRERVFDRPETVKRHVYVGLWLAAYRLGILGLLQRARHMRLRTPSAS